MSNGDGVDVAGARVSKLLYRGDCSVPGIGLRFEPAEIMEGIGEGIGKESGVFMGRGSSGCLVGADPWRLARLSTGVN